MKRRSQPKSRKSKGTYARKLNSKTMMYGHNPHNRFTKWKAKVGAK